MPGLLPHIDPEGLLEFSVVYTDRVLNHMSRRFQGVMTEISTLLKEVYAADAAVLVPGSGTFGMEAVARQLANEEKVLIVRNGYFSYRWSQILEAGRITDAANITVLKARRTGEGSQAPWAPAPIEEVEAAIARVRPGVVFVPHVETASGILLPDAYLARIAQAVHAVGGLLVLDCVASGAVWVNMREVGVDVLISAPQKGWSSSPACAMIGLSARALPVLERTSSTSFAMDLKKWHQIMQSYENGSHAYHATMPTMALLDLHQTMLETRQRGFEVVREQQFELGRKVRELLVSRGFPSAAAPGFEAPGVVVSYTTDPDIQNAKKFIEHGIQSAGGVPLMCDEPADFCTFRIGLFGLDKWANVDRSVGHLSQALDAMGFPG